MSKYKIGEVAKILGLPNDTLRYYESRGIVTPQKDEETGYRYYDAWDLNFLLDSKWYRSFDFSLNDVVQMINEDDLGNLIDRFTKHEFEMLQLIYEYRRKLDALVLQRQKLLRLRDNPDVFELCIRPPLIYQRHRYEYEYIFEEGMIHANKWTDLMPLVNHTFTAQYYPKYTASDSREYYWGFSLSPEAAIENGISMSPPAEYFPPVKSIYTIFCAQGRGTFMEALHTQVAARVRDAGYDISGPFVGNLIVRLHEDGAFKRYFEVWAPID